MSDKCKLLKEFMEVEQAKPLFDKFEHGTYALTSGDIYELFDKAVDNWMERADKSKISKEEKDLFVSFSMDFAVDFIEALVNETISFDVPTLSVEPSEDTEKKA